MYIQIQASCSHSYILKCKHTYIHTHTYTHVYTPIKLKGNYKEQKNTQHQKKRGSTG